MGPALLHLLMRAVVDGYVHENATEENVEHLSNAKVTTIVLMNFDSMPNAVLDSMLNEHNLCERSFGKEKRRYTIDVKLYFNQ